MPGVPKSTGDLPAHRALGNVTLPSLPGCSRCSARGWRWPWWHTQVGEKLREKPGKVLEAQTKVTEKALAAVQVASAKRGLF